MNKIDTNNLSTVLGELSQASAGEGPKIAASISAGTQLAGLLDRTLNAQLLALDSFAKFTQAVAPAASDLNNLNAQINAGLPAFNAEEADYENLLNTLIPFSNRLAALLSTYHPDIATILESGDNVSRVLLAQQDTIGQVVNGAYHYFQKIAQGASGLNKLPDGSTYAYFNTFILFSDVNSLVCNLIAPPTGGMSFLQPIQQALAGAGSAFNCSSELASFNALQTTPASPAAAATAATPQAASPTAAASQAGAAAANQAYGIIGQPDNVATHESRRHYHAASRGPAMRLLRYFPASAFKFALFALVCLVLLIGLAVKIGNLSLFTSRHTIDAQLTDVTGLASGDGVNIAGVPVGQVSSISVQHGHALVAMSVNNTVTLHRSTDVGMRWHNVIGQKEIELYPGRGGPVLAPGSTIPLTHDVTRRQHRRLLELPRPAAVVDQPDRGQRVRRERLGRARRRHGRDQPAAQQRRCGVLDRRVPRHPGGTGHRQSRPGAHRARVALGRHRQPGHQPPDGVVGAGVEELVARRRRRQPLAGGDRPGQPYREQPQHHHEHHRQPAGRRRRRPEQQDEPGQQPLDARCRTGPLHPGLPVGPMVRGRDDLHLPGRPDSLSVLPAEQPARRLWPLREPAAAGAPLGRHDAGTPEPETPRRRARAPRHWRRRVWARTCRRSAGRQRRPRERAATGSVGATP